MTNETNKQNHRALVWLGIGIVALVVAIAILVNWTPGFDAPVVEATEPAPKSLAALAGIEATQEPENLPMEAVFNGVAYADTFGFTVEGGCGVRYGTDQMFVMVNGQFRKITDGEQTFVFGCEQGEFFLRAASTEAELTSTPTPAVEETPVSTGTLTAGTQSFANGTIRISGFPETSVPARWGNGVVQSNTSPVDSVAWIAADGGVISADHTADCAGNLSCVWSGGASVDNLMENTTGSYSCPEGGYVKVTYPQGTITIGELSVSVDAVADTAYTTLIRCPYAENSEGDDSVRIDFTIDHDYAGNMKVMRYPVPVEAGGFFSFVHLEEDLNNALGISDRYDRDGADNCGEDGCADAKVILIDVNHGSLGVYNYSGPSQWQKLHQNVVRPTPAQ